MELEITPNLWSTSRPLLALYVSTSCSHYHHGKDDAHQHGHVRANDHDISIKSASVYDVTLGENRKNGLDGVMMV